MKGRIIGREGRNIRAFETATGVDVIIDDTPDTVVISCFDPIRREVARRALEALIPDGRIHPGRIEEIVAKVQKELETAAGRAGRAGGLRHRHPRPASRADQADRPDALPHLVRAEHLRAFEGSGLARRHDGGRAAARRRSSPSAAACCTTSARCSPTRARAPTSSSAWRWRASTARARAVINCIQAHHDDVPHEIGRVGAGAGGRRDQRRPARARGARRSRAT